MHILIKNNQKVKLGGEGHCSTKELFFRKKLFLPLMGLFTSDANDFDADDACGVMGKYVLKKSGKISRGNPFKNDLHLLLTSLIFFKARFNMVHF